MSPLAIAEESGTCGDNLTYTLSDGGVLTITGSGEMTSNPTNYANASSIKTIIVGEGVTSLYNEFGRYASNLTSVSLPSTLRTIGYNCFDQCTSLPAITLPEGVETIDSYFCSDCYNLQSIVIPSTVTTINDEFCRNCYNLEEIILPNSVTSIGINFAYQCKKLKRLVLSTSLQAIPDAFCNSCYVLENFEIPSSVTSIGWGFLQGNRTIKSFTLPTTVTTIGNYFLGNCMVESVQLHSGITALPVQFCMSCRYLYNFTIPESVVTIGYEAFGGTSCLGQLVVPNSVTSIGNRFAAASGIQKLTLGTGITTIPQEMCTGCSNLKQVVTTVDFTEIGRAAFTSCPELTEFTIPNNCFTIGQYVLSGCAKLQTVNIGSGVNEIGNNAFERCPKLREFNVSAENQTFSSIDGVIYDKLGTRLELYPCGRGPVFVLPENVSVITGKPYAFGCASGIRSLVLNNNITSISTEEFNKTSLIEEVVFGNNVLYLTNLYNLIGTNYTSSNNNIKQIVLPTATPPQFPSNPEWYQTPASAIKLYVPEASVETYKAATGWNYFDVRPIPYKITLEGADAHGCCMYAPLYAEAGTTVTITPYRVKDLCENESVTVTDADDNIIECEKQADGTYTFVMPAKNVTITSVMVQNYLVNLVTNEEYWDNYTLVVPDVSVTQQAAGKPVVISMANNPHYTITSITVTDANDANVGVTPTDGGDSWTFTMPASDVTIEYTLSRSADVPTNYSYWTHQTEGPIAEGDYLIAFNLSLIHIDEPNYGYAVVDPYSNLMQWRLRRYGEIDGNDNILSDKAYRVHITPAGESDYYYVQIQNGKYIGFNQYNNYHGGMGYYNTPKALKIEFDGDNHITIKGEGKGVEMATYSKTWGFRPNYTDNEFMQDTRFELFKPKADSPRVFTRANTAYVATGAASAEFAMNDNANVLDIPETITDDEDNTYTITSVANNAALYCESLYEVNLPNSITSIGNQAFAHSGVGVITFGSNGSGDSGNSGDGEKPEKVKTSESTALTVASDAFTGAYNIYEINCWLSEPPTGVQFEDVVYQYATINVDPAYLDAYKNAPGWSQFWNEEPKDVTVEVGKSGYQTLYYSDRALQVPKGIAGWIFADYGKGLTAEKYYESSDKADAIIPAGEAVVLYTETPGEYTFTATTSKEEPNSFNLLHGTDTEQEVTVSGTPYILANGSNGIGFYQAAAKGGNTFTNGAHKAYLEIPKGKDAPAYIVIDFKENNGTSGIKGISVDDNTSDVMYNILGMPVGNDYKGFVIKNGKKFINK